MLPNHRFILFRGNLNPRGTLVWPDLKPAEQLWRIGFCWFKRRRREKKSSELIILFRNTEGDQAARAGHLDGLINSDALNAIRNYLRYLGLSWSHTTLPLTPPMLILTRSIRNDQVVSKLVLQVTRHSLRISLTHLCVLAFFRSL